MHRDRLRIIVAAARQALIYGNGLAGLAGLADHPMSAKWSFAAAARGAAAQAADSVARRRPGDPDGRRADDGAARR